MSEVRNRGRIEEALVVVIDEGLVSLLVVYFTI